jgi:hypothetical protein
VKREHRLLTVGIGAVASIAAAACSSAGAEPSPALGGSSEEAGAAAKSVHVTGAPIERRTRRRAHLRRRITASIRAASATPWADRDDSIWRSVQPGTVENGDLCELSRIREPLAGGFLYQRLWSNEPVLRLRRRPAVVNAGVTHGRGALADLAPKAGLELRTSLGVGTKGKCGARQGVNNGVEGTLSVTAPAEAKSGDFAVVWIRNFREEASTCNPSPDTDWTHFWPVGVYVE